MSTVDERPAGGTNESMTTIELPGCPWWCLAHPDPAAIWRSDVGDGFTTTHSREFGTEGIVLERWDEISTSGDLAIGTPSISAWVGAEGWDDLSADTVAERVGVLNDAAAFLRSLEAGR